MNRRSFLKALFGLFTAAMIPPQKRETMEIGNILAKLGSGTLTPQEQEALRLWGNDTQKRNGALPGIENNGAETKIQNLLVENGRYNTSTISGCHFYSSALTSVPTASYTPIVLERPVFNSNSILLPRSGSDTIFDINPNYNNRKKVIHISGKSTWASDANGTRTFTLRTYRKSDDALTGTDYLYQLPAANGVTTVVPFITTFYWDTYSNFYIKFEGWQNSGSTLDLGTTYISAFLVY